MAWRKGDNSTSHWSLRYSSLYSNTDREGISNIQQSRFKIRNLFTDGRCSQAVLDFLATTDVGRLVPAEEDAGSEVSEWERREREEERRAELGAGGGGGLPLFLPTPDFMASADKE